MLKIAYCAGLRRNEVLALKIEDLDWKNMQIIVRIGKGKKGRYTLLAQSIKEDYDEYVKKFSPETYLFYGRPKNQSLSEAATRWTINQAIKRANISKTGICFHSLRHSFATHLLAINTDVVTVQMLLGHTDIRTTMEYFHLGNRPNKKAKSPLDVIFPKK